MVRVKILFNRKSNKRKSEGIFSDHKLTFQGDFNVELILAVEQLFANDTS